VIADNERRVALLKLYIIHVGLQQVLVEMTCQCECYGHSEGSTLAAIVQWTNFRLIALRMVTSNNLPLADSKFFLKRHHDSGEIDVDIGGSVSLVML
jgi:hypothetical protein